MSVRCGNHATPTNHATVADVRACFATPNIEQIEREMHAMEAQADREESERDAASKVAKWDAEAGEPSIAELTEMVNQMLCRRAVPESDWRWSREVRRYIHGNAGTITAYGLRTAIARLQSYPEIPAVNRTSGPLLGPVEAEGLYRLNDRLYQVVRGKESGRLYAKLVTFQEGKKRPILSYARGVIFDLTPAHLVPANEAEELTRKTGWCVFGHFLTNPKSIARGMGPVCYARYGARNAEAA